MLSYMRQNAGSWLIKVLLGGVALSFVIGFGVLPSLRDKKSESVVAQVGERKITREEWDRAYSNMVRFYQQMYQDRFSDALAQQLRLRETALDNLVNRALQLREAQRLGLAVSNEELQQSIQEMPVFQRSGRFEKEAYVRVLQLNRMTPGDFEEEQRKEILLGKLEQLVQETVKVSDQEAWQQYVLEKDQINVEAIRVEPANLEDAVEMTEGALLAYFDANKERFRTKEKAKVEYVLFKPDGYKDLAKVYTGDIEEYYEDHIDDYSHPEDLHLRHILLRVAPGADEAERQEKEKKLKGLLDQIRGGLDFAVVAQANSEDTPSARKGGDLGFVKRGELVPEVEEVAFAMKPGEVSDIVSSSHGLHLLKVEEYRASRVDPLEEVQDKIREELVQETAWRLARRKAEEFFRDARTRGSLKSGAPSESAEGVQVQETGFFARGESIPGVGRESELNRMAFTLENGEVSSVVKGAKGYYILRVLERKPPEIPELEAVRESVEQSYRKEKSKDLAGEKAAEMLAALAAGNKSLEEIAKDEGFSTFETGMFSRMKGRIPRIGASEELVEGVFALSGENPIPAKPYEVNGKFFVIRFKERKVADRNAFLEEKPEYKKRLEETKGQELFRQWLSELRKQEDVQVMPMSS